MIELEEAVAHAVGAVHPIERLELGAEHIGEELDLLLHVLGVEREMVNARLLHGNSSCPCGFASGWPPRGALSEYHKI